MKVLLVTQPGLGHLHPLVPLAHELQRAGHRVAFACATLFCSEVATLGFHCFPAGLDWLESRAEDAFPELREMPVEKQPWDWFVTEVFADIAAMRMAPDLLKICHEWQPDLIVRNDYEFASCVVAEQLNIPCVTVAVESFLPAATWESLVGDQLAYLRSIYGLKPYPATDMLHQHLYFSSMPPGYEFPSLAAVSTAHSYQPKLHDHTGHVGLPDWVARLPSRPTIFATLGTVFNRLPEVFLTIVAGLQDEPVNLIITVGRSQDPAALGPLPDNVYVEQYIPMSLILPYCDLAITHGGYQTMVSVLYHGLPTLTIPITATDPIRAQRCLATGIGLAILPDHLRAAIHRQGLWASQQLAQADQWLTLAPETIRGAVRQLLHEPCYGQNARRLRDEMKALPGLEQVLKLLSKLVLEKPVRY